MSTVDYVSIENGWYDDMNNRRIFQLTLSDEDTVLHELAKTSQLVVADDCVAYWRNAWSEEKRSWADALAMLGPLRLPYDRCWVEYHDPVRDFRCAAVIEQLSPKLVWARLCYQHRNDAPYIPGYWVGLTLDESGYQAVQLGGGLLMADGRTPDAVSAQPADYDHQLDLVTVNTYPALMAIGLMNCKNVPLDNGSTRPVKGKGHKRRAIPAYRHVIVRVPRPTAKASESTGESEGFVPWHLVRGHFKTYTADAPLFGKHTGTYWWSWHAQGRPDAGEITKEYHADPGGAASNESG
ncbi:MAG: hypothetical protein J2P17_33385 [Mycobacterium sp.]|nr:hypothetical protein [Mycobacterium sp.]